jgi:predicted CXXCH cytochrome family protein
MSNGKSTWLLLLLCTLFARAQQIDVAIGPNREVRAVSLFDEIQDARERSAFRELWETRDPAKQRERALEFIERYPRSTLLKEAYEIAARACVALGDELAGLEWAKRSLRLLPENPFLLAMAANLAAKHGEYQWAATSARQALNYLDRAAAPSSLSAAAWPQVRDSLRETAYFALGRAAAAAGKNQEGEEWLLDALRLNAGDYEAIYALGIVRAAAHDDDGAADCFAKVMDASSGPLAEAARLSLRRIYGRQAHAAGTFDEFRASRKWQPPAPPASPPKRITDNRYAGSAACRECHASEYNNWQQTGMAKMFRPYRKDDSIGDFSGKQILAGGARAIQQGDRPFIELRDQSTGNWTSYRVDFLIGSKWQQAYATKLSNGEMLVLPIQYSRVEGAWVNYWKIVDGGASARSDLGHFQGTPDGALYQRDCAPCHTSQLRYPSNTSAPATASFLEGGVDCEMCHGPSLAHVESLRSGRKANPHAATEPPIDFKRIAPEESVAICGQCHMQSAIHEPESSGAVNFAESAEPFYRTYSTHLLSDFTRKAFFADGRFRATTFIGEAFLRSRCFREGGATCVSCHSPHSEGAAANTKSLKFAEDSDEMCVQCHASLRLHPERHSRHAAGTEASRCVTCHMPRNMDALLFRARSHQIDEIPNAQMTARFGESDSPNACLTCHRDRDTSWLTGQLSAWRGRP